ncbi:Taste Receptor Type 2 Member 8 [Manis pentadactyla]|nr:Taste Receptor Type 2 Member 8 [Manis pentadactyla]
MLGNVCVGLIHWIDWIKKTKISSADYILTSLAIALISLLSVMILDGIILVLYADFYEVENRQGGALVLLGSLAVSSLASLTLATTLSYDCEFHTIAIHRRNFTEMFHVPMETCQANETHGFI